MQPDAQLSFTAGYFGGFLRNTIAAQILPWMEVGIRYSVLDDYLGGSGDTTLYDRSLDLKLRMFEEGPAWPSLALGFQDFLGTVIYSGEYVTATKNVATEDLLGGDLKLTGGILNRVFQQALQTAKEIRTRTQIGRGATSVGSVPPLVSQSTRQDAPPSAAASSVASACSGESL